MTPSAFFPFLVLVLAQLLGDGVANTLGLPLPGSVVGAAALFAVLCVAPGLHARIAPFAHTLLRNMLLFFVPASVGIMVIFGDVASHGPLLAAVTVLSTWATALVSAVAFDLLSRRRGAAAR